jgi:RimK family alpha-L-glutamate ligase
MKDDRMTGWLVVNEFLQSNKFNEIHVWLMEAAVKQKIDMILKTNAQLLVDLPGIKQPGMNQPGKKQTEAFRLYQDNEPDFILFWDKDVRLAAYLEQLGYPVFNSSQAIAACDDKSLTHLALMKAGIPMPRTILAPKTFDNIGYTNMDFLKEVADRLGFPMVVKECFGSFGQQVYLAHNLKELIVLLGKTGTKPVLFQKFIASSAGRDIRLQVVGGRVIASMYRYSENGDFRANLTIGGKMKSYEPTVEQSRLAIRCCEILGLDYAGVDILFGEENQPLICEVNSNAHFKNIYDCTGVNAADAILTHIRNKLRVTVQP